MKPQVLKTLTPAHGHMPGDEAFNLETLGDTYLNYRMTV